MTITERELVDMSFRPTEESRSFVRGRTLVRFVSKEFYSNQPGPPRVRNGVEVLVHGVKGTVEHQGFFQNAPEQGRRVHAFLLEWDISLWCSKCGKWAMTLEPGDPEPTKKDYRCANCALRCDSEP